MDELTIPPSLRVAHRRAFARYLGTRQSAIIGKRVELVAMRRDATEFRSKLRSDRSKRRAS